jgi:hypothetical protein
MRSYHHVGMFKLSKCQSLLGDDDKDTLSSRLSGAYDAIRRGNTLNLGHDYKSSIVFRDDLIYREAGSALSLN